MSRWAAGGRSRHGGTRAIIADRGGGEPQVAVRGPRYEPEIGDTDDERCSLFAALRLHPRDVGSHSHL